MLEQAKAANSDGFANRLVLVFPDLWCKGEFGYSPWKHQQAFLERVYRFVLWTAGYSPLDDDKEASSAQPYPDPQEWTMESEAEVRACSRIAYAP